VVLLFLERTDAIILYLSIMFVWDSFSGFLRDWTHKSECLDFMEMVFIGKTPFYRLTSSVFSYYILWQCVTTGICLPHTTLLCTENRSVSPAVWATAAKWETVTHRQMATTPDRCMDPAVHTMRALRITTFLLVLNDHPTRGPLEHVDLGNFCMDLY